MSAVCGWPSTLGALARRLFVASFALAVLPGVAPSLAQTSGASTVRRSLPLPPGLASVWRVDGRKLDDRERRVARVSSRAQHARADARPRQRGRLAATRARRRAQGFVDSCRGSIGPFAFDERAAAYSYDGRLEIRDVASGALAWAATFAPPGIDAVVDDVPMRLDLVALARRGDRVLSYESPVSGSAPGTLVVRRLSDGQTVAMYDVAGVSALAVAPDGGSFVYSTGAGRTYSVLARVPR